MVSSPVTEVTVQVTVSDRNNKAEDNKLLHHLLQFERKQTKCSFMIRRYFTAAFRSNYYEHKGLSYTMCVCVFFT